MCHNITTDSIRIRGGETAPLALQVVGFYPGVYKAQVMLKDNTLGEFTVEVVSKKRN